MYQLEIQKQLTMNLNIILASITIFLLISKTLVLGILK